MNNLDNMLERNKDFAAQQSAAGALMPSLPRALPNVKAIIIGCADMRGSGSCIELAGREMPWMCNIGGRTTRLLEQLPALANR